MADTRGFDVLVEARDSFLTKGLRGAWKSALCPDIPGDEGRIPENIDIPDDTTDPNDPNPQPIHFDGYDISQGQIQLPQDELSAALAPVVDGAELSFGLHMQLCVDQPPVPSAGLLDMTATVKALVPIRVPAGEQSVWMILEEAGNVAATLTSGDPLAPKFNQLIREYIHEMLYPTQGGTAFEDVYTEQDKALVALPSTGTPTFLSIKGDTYTQIFDNLGEPKQTINVSGPAAGQVVISIPLYLNISDIQKSGSLSGSLTLLEPMGVDTRINFAAPFLTAPGKVGIDFSTAAVSVDPIQQADTQLYGPVDGPNYSANKAAVSAATFNTVNLDTLIAQEIKARGELMKAAIGLREIAVPTVAAIEAAIADLFLKELVKRKRLAVWTPQDSPDIALDVQDVTSRVHPAMLAIGLNADPGSDIGSVPDFIPGGREFAIALSAAQCEAAFDQALADNGMAPGNMPRRMNADGKDVDLNSIDVGLDGGSIGITGSVTVIDAIAGSIDVDADYRSNVGLEWYDEAGGQAIRSVQIGDPDIDPADDTVGSWLIWLIIGILTLGLAGGLIALLIRWIVKGIVERIAEKIGGRIVEDQIGEAVGFSGWPDQLDRVGYVRTRFENPILIDPSGIVIAGTLTVISTCENTAIAFADSGSAYVGAAASPLKMSAQKTHGDADYTWDPGDGSGPQAVRDITHSYVQSGHYIAEHALKMVQPGGAHTRHFADVDVANIPPVVDAGEDIVVKEGEVVTLVGRFHDVEYPDRHSSTWFFGDCQAPMPGKVNETNAPPRAAGTSTVTHAWCDNGRYVVTLMVQDQDGGIGLDTRTVTVLNVPPVVDAGPDCFAYRCMPITLVGRFTDAGWCDTHVATWDFGDCTDARAAEVLEKHEPPEGVGTATATHIYECCGTFEARCLVTDDDGDSGTDTVRVDVVELRNAGFEEGFRRLGSGRVGNHWQPYLAASRLAAAQRAARLPAPKELPAGSYDCEECIVREGQRSQRFAAGPHSRAGIWQKLGSNPHWSYEFVAWAFTQPGATAWLGLDCEGGDDPSAERIVWTRVADHSDWASLSVRGCATGAAVTVFAEIETAERGSEGYFDAFSFTAQQEICCEAEPEEEPPGDLPVRRLCLSFDEIPLTVSVPVIDRDGFSVSARGGGGLRTWSFPAITGTLLQLPMSGVDIRLPFAADTIVARVATAGGKPPRIQALDASGAEVGAAEATTQQQVVQTLSISAEGIVSVSLFGQEAGLLELCIERRGDEASGGEPGRDRADMGEERRDKLSADLREALAGSGRDGGSEPVPVIIAVEPLVPRETDREPPQEDPEARFEAEVKPLLQRLEAICASDIRPLWIGRAVSARLPLDAVRELVEDPQVRTIALDRKRSAI